MNVYDKVPYVHKDAFIAPSASITGDVQIGQASSIWYGCVLRGKPTKPFIIRLDKREHATHVGSTDASDWRRPTCVYVWHRNMSLHSINSFYWIATSVDMFVLVLCFGA